MIVLPVIVIVVIGATFGGQGRLDVGLVQRDHGPFAARVARAMRAERRMRSTTTAPSPPSAGGAPPDDRRRRSCSIARSTRPIARGPHGPARLRGEPGGGSGAHGRDRAPRRRGADRRPCGRRAVRRAHDRKAVRRSRSPLADGLGGSAAAAVRARNVGARARPRCSAASRRPRRRTSSSSSSSRASRAAASSSRRAARACCAGRVATRTGVGTILLGLGLGWFAIALVQSVIILAVGAIFFGVDWGAPLPAALLVVDFAMVGCGAGLLLGALGRDEDKVSSIAPVLGIVLGALGRLHDPARGVPARRCWPSPTPCPSTGPSGRGRAHLRRSGDGGDRTRARASSPSTPPRSVLRPRSCSGGASRASRHQASVLRARLGATRAGSFGIFG